MNGISKKHLAISGMILLLVAVGVIVFVSYQPTSASTHPLLQSQNSDDEPKLDPTILVDEDSSTHAAKVAKEIVERWEDKVIQRGEWLHLVKKINSEIDNGVILPDGKPMPPSYLEDGWYFINEIGLVDKHVVTLRDESGVVYQQSVHLDENGYNLTFGTKFGDAKPYKLKLDGGFVQYLEDVESLGILVKDDDILENGVSIKEFTHQEVFDVPRIIGNSPWPIQSTTVSGLFDTETNEMIKYSKIYHSEDGNQLVFDGWELLLVENLRNAPPNILEILESVK